MSEYEYEPIRGVPGKLPEGEMILWQGSPRWTSLARHMCHVRPIAAYFVALMMWRVAVTVYDGRPISDAWQINSWLTLMLAASVGLACLFAWLVARTTVYTVTNRRVMLRFGIALQKNVNVPFRHIESAGIRCHSDGTGDIPLKLSEGKIAYLLLWPHARPFRLTHPEPMLRGVTEPGDVAKLLAKALVNYSNAVASSNYSGPEEKRVLQPNSRELQHAAA